MALGWVLVKTKPGRDREVFQALVKAPGVEEVFPLFGDWDVILKMEAADFDELGRRIVQGVRSIPGVHSTHTLTVTMF